MQRYLASLLFALFLLAGPAHAEQAQPPKAEWGKDSQWIIMPNKWRGCPTDKSRCELVFFGPDCNHVSATVANPKFMKQVRRYIRDKTGHDPKALHCLLPPGSGDIVASCIHSAGLCTATPLLY